MEIKKRTRVISEPFYGLDYLDLIADHLKRLREPDVPDLLATPAGLELIFDTLGLYQVFRGEGTTILFDALQVALYRAMEKSGLIQIVH